MHLDSFSIPEDASDCPLPDLDGESTLVLLFADPAFHDRTDVWARLCSHFKKSILLGCSTAGNIVGEQISDGSVEGVAVRFDRTAIQLCSTPISGQEDSFAAGRRLASQLPREGLRAVFLLSEGLAVNGSLLLQGLASQLPTGVGISGGLAADGNRFQKTWILAGDTIGSNLVAAVGFYGEHFHFSYGSEGGWDKFGVARRVTRSVGSTLYELDGKPALKLYKEYLGDQSSGLPATGLLFPLSIRQTNESEPLVRTILQVNEEEQSLTFAGDIPGNSIAQLMKANLDRIIDGATQAAQQAANTGGSSLSALAIAVSCVGRRLVLRGRAEEELEASSAVFSAGTRQIGFYSYGEVAPRSAGGASSLHNQTMTVTLLHE